MLTPQDIQSKEFAKAVFGGYDMTAVDDFLEELSNDYAALYKENAILKSKIKVLVEKVEEYRSTEDAMRMALLTAQKMGDDLLSDAKEKSSTMIADADKQAQEKIAEYQQAIENEEAKYNLAKEKTQQFVLASTKIIENYSEFLSNLDDMAGNVRASEEKAETAPAPAPQPKAQPQKPTAAPAAAAAPEADKEAKREEEIVDTAKQIDAFISNMLKDDPNPSNAPASSADEQTRVFRTKDTTVDWSDDDEPTSPRPKFDFNNLQFGTNYSDSDK